MTGYFETIPKQGNNVPNSRKSLGSAAATMLLILLSSGCASIDETHYLQSLDKSGQAVNYFRLTVKGSTQASRSRYIAGYFDEKAVDLLFDEYKAHENDNRRIYSASGVGKSEDEKDGANTASSSGSPVKVAPLATGVQDDGKVFVMIISNNAKNVVDQIGSFVDSQTFAEALAMVANKDKFVELSRLNAGKSTQDARYAALLTDLQKRFEMLKGAKSRPDFEIAVVQILEAIVTAVDGPVRFKDFAEAKKEIDTLLIKARSSK